MRTCFYTEGEWNVMSAPSPLPFTSGQDFSVGLISPLGKPAMAFGSTLEEATSNAYLISAAPDMHQMLERIRHWETYMTPQARHDMNRIIMKAKGH